MEQLNPKEFIQKVFIDELGTMIQPHPYISFSIMAIGIEFLGKCLKTKQKDFDYSGIAKEDFNNSIKGLASLKKYESLDLYNELRNGMLHFLKPKTTLLFSSNVIQNHLKNEQNVTTINCEDLYQDFKDACIEIINKTFDVNDKMNRVFISINNNYTGHTVTMTNNSFI